MLLILIDIKAQAIRTEKAQNIANIFFQLSENCVRTLLLKAFDIVFSTSVVKQYVLNYNLFNLHIHKL